MEEQMMQSGRTIGVNLEEEMRKAFLEYSMSVIISRHYRMCVTV